MSAPAATLEKAVEEAKDTLAELDADPKERAFLLIRGPVALRCVHALRSLLAALDADKSACEPGVICPTCVRLEGAEKALRFYANAEIYEETTTTHGLVPACGPPIVIEDGGEVARRYFAERGER